MWEEELETIGSDARVRGVGGKEGGDEEKKRIDLLKRGRGGSRKWGNALEMEKKSVRKGREEYQKRVRGVVDRLERSGDSLLEEGEGGRHPKGGAEHQPYSTHRIV